MEMQTENRLTDLGSGRWRGWDQWREHRGNIGTAICGTDSQGDFLYDPGNSNQALGQPRGVGGGREAREGGDICIPVAESMVC